MRNEANDAYDWDTEFIFDPSKRTPPPKPTREMGAAIEVFRNRPGFKGTAEKFTCRCPAHEDHENSLSVSECGDGRVLICCHAGCEAADICAAEGLTLADLQPPREPAAKVKPQIDRTYDYHDADGRLVFQVVRMHPKSFRQRQPDASKPGGWRWNLEGVERVLYRLPELLRAKAEGRAIFLCEGEKDADNLAALGLTATTNPGGVANWRPEHAQTLTGANVVVLADNDAPGLKGARVRALSIPGARLLLLPDLPAHGDVSDWLAAGGTRAELERLAVEATPPSPDDDEGDDVPDVVPAEILPLSDMANWRALAAQPLDCIFEDGHMLAATMALIAAPGGVGKSYLALELGISVALGVEVIPGFTPAREGRVLLCFGEDNEHVVSRRMAAVCRVFGIEPDTIDAALADGRLQFICGRRARLLEFTLGGAGRLTAAHAELVARCRENQYRLVVIDPVIKWAGLPNENDNAAQETAAGALIDLAQATVTGCCLGIHHANKAATKTGDQSQTASRGGSALPDASRWMATLSLLDEDTLKRAGMDPEEEIARITFAKNSNGPTRRNRPIYLEKTDGGVLRFVEWEDVQSNALLLAIVEEIRANPPGLTARELYKSTAEHAENFRIRVAARVAAEVKTGWRAFQDAIVLGLQNGALTANPHPENPNRREVEVTQ